MNATIKLIGSVVLALLLYTVILRIFTPEYLTETVEIETETTVNIDSSAVYREYSERIPPEEADTVYIDTLEVPVPVALDEDRNEYTTTYSDSTITAKWTSVVDGYLESQDFEYLIKRRVVRERELTITQNITTLTTETITKVRAPQPYFTAGAEFTNLQSLSVGGGYVTRNRYRIYYRYNLDLDAHTVGISIPIRFNLRTIL